MTSTFHLLLVLSLHGPAAHADLSEADHWVQLDDGGQGGRAVFAEEIEDSEDDRPEMACGRLGASRRADRGVDFEVHLAPASPRGDAVASHSARGPPAA